MRKTDQVSPSHRAAVSLKWWFFSKGVRTGNYLGNKEVAKEVPVTAV